MEENAQMRNLRVLLCFLQSDPEDCTVTGISRTLHEEKYTVSRAMAALEKEGAARPGGRAHADPHGEGLPLRPRCARPPLPTGETRGARQIK